MWNKLLLGMVVALSLAILSLSLLNKTKGDTIDLLEKSLYSYEKASERNLRVIGALEDDVTYLNRCIHFLLCHKNFFHNKTFNKLN